jgi:hypothetical protein
MSGVNSLERVAKESESLINVGRSEKNCSGERVNLFGSIE